MKILESLQDRVPDTGGLNRIVVLGPDSGASYISAVIVRLPPQHEFPRHVHPDSEDCFFVLSGTGEVFSQEQRFPVSEVSGVWVPAGAPHGFAAGESGILEIGFQSPPGPTVEPVDSCVTDNCRNEILGAPISPGPGMDRDRPEWRRVFADRCNWQYLDPQYCFLDTSQHLHAVADGCELLVAVVRGGIKLSGIDTHFSSITIIQLKPGESEVIRALETNTLLLGIRAFG